MKKIAFTLATIIGVISLMGCQGTSNSSTPSTVSNSCTTNAYGQSVNTSTGLPCVNNNYCGTSGYNPYNGYNGSPYSSQYGYACSGYGTVGGYGTQYGLGGCMYWSQVYPDTQYVPMIDPSSGQLVCINATSYGINVPSTYTYSTPVYYAQPCQYYGDPTCYGSYNPYSAYGYGYGGYNPYGGGGTCLGAGSGDFMFGLCF